ncbi:DUF89 domain protein [Plectosphaerella plurivora]|uniref:Sugar phosphate phosphatase n=1 Tax=Plectosphaerella plurivora TaxID=936078 RepID=A0A9P9AFP0_9PEZI|nr:DUF89 domain protein [Plectosphaerella plurivora]
MSYIFYSEGPREIWTSEEGSMAFETARSRWPKIVQGMIDDVEQTVKELPSNGKRSQHGLQIRDMLKQLKSHIEHDKPLLPLFCHGSTEISEYNLKLASFGSCSWHNCPWLFGECYLYRRVNIMFTSFPDWEAYDVFARQKLETFLKSEAAVQELSSRYTSLRQYDNLQKADSEAAYLLFVEMTEVALWGNATDLSLLSQLSLEQIHSLQGAQAIQEGQARIVSNDTRAIWEYLNDNRGGDVDIVLDNAGYEFFTDLVYSLYLLDAGLASKIRLHVKSIPWFVSDVMRPDIGILFEAIQSMNGPASDLGSTLKKLFDDTRITIHEHRFWTTGCDFHEMPSAAPDLFLALRASTLVIFKGDLNYRKLVRDAAWPYSTPFKNALGALAGGSRSDDLRRTNGSAPGLKVVALRTNKADVCVGVDESTLQRMEKEAPGAAWVRNGKYAVVSFSDGL